MTYTGKPNSNRRDAVRLLIGDTDIDDELLTDDEVDYHLNQHSQNYLAASACATSIAAKFTRLVDRSVGALSAGFSAKSKQYHDLAVRLASKRQLDQFYPESLGTAPPEFHRGEMDNLRYGGGRVAQEFTL